MKTNMKHKRVCKTYPTLDIKKIVLKTIQIGIDQLGMTLRYNLKRNRQFNNNVPYFIE